MTSTDTGWKDISSAPKRIVARDRYNENLTNEYGPYILAYPVFGEVTRVRWWQASNNTRACNFLEDGGNAVHPTHWRPLPPPPIRGDEHG